jgi:ubiquinone/menaquinone biosynthesis C-methylase UbiE
MPLLDKLKQYLTTPRRPETDPAAAYDIWALQYDRQPDNLMLALDERLFSLLLEEVVVTGKVIADIGCGTGRHWKKLLDRSPARLIGYDVSEGMLAILRQKYPMAETRLPNGESLPGLPDASCDLLLSTLTVAHIPDIEGALTEWDRVLKPGGEMLITDYHPQALARGGQRTFREGDKVIAIRNHVYPIRKLTAIAKRLKLEVLGLREIKIDDSMKPYYEKQNALGVYERFFGVRIIYGLHLKKPDAIQ